MCPHQRHADKIKRIARKLIKVFFITVLSLIAALILLVIAFVNYVGVNELDGITQTLSSPNGELTAVLVMYSGGLPPESNYGLFVFPAASPDDEIWLAVEDIDDACIVDHKSFPDFYWKDDHNLGLESKYKNYYITDGFVAIIS